MIFEKRKLNKHFVTVSCFFLNATAFLIKHGTNNKFSMHGNVCVYSLLLKIN